MGGSGPKAWKTFQGTASFFGTTMTVKSTAAGAFYVGGVVDGAFFTYPTYVTSIGPIVGGFQTYGISRSANSNTERGVVGLLHSAPANGTGGGGDGGNGAAGAAGAVNTGGGGGGGGYNQSTSKAGGAGGRGIVIIRYPI
jgi:hypothetical protein